MDPRYERLYDSGHAQVYPLPQRDPMRALADWGAPPEPPIQPDRPPLDDERAYVSPGPPPWADRAQPRRKGAPARAVLLIVLGVLALCAAGVWWVLISPADPPVPSIPLTTSPATL